MKYFRFTAHIPIDFDKERSRVKKCFKDDKPAMKRQLHLLDLFEQSKFKEWEQSYSDLPYNEKDECPEQEYVGIVFHDIVTAVAFGKYTVEKCQLDDK